MERGGTGAGPAVPPPCPGFLLGHAWRGETRSSFFHSGRRYGMEFKFKEAPAMTKSMGSALQDTETGAPLGCLSRRASVPIEKKVSAWPFKDFPSLSKELNLDVPSVKERSRRRKSWISFEKAGKKAEHRANGREVRPEQMPTQYHLIVLIIVRYICTIYMCVRC